MFAINHAATALVLKKKYPSVPILFLLISVQLIEFLWVIFNYAGIEFTTTNDIVRTVNDIHLAFMPYSHSIIATLLIAGTAWIFINKLFKKPVIAWAVALGIVSHIILDLVTHNFDIAIAPFIDAPKLGTGLYSIPFAGLIIETAYGVGCWWYYQGNKTLLSIIFIFNLANITMFTSLLSGPESLMAHKPMLLTTVILLQIVVTLFLVGYFSRKPDSIKVKKKQFV